MRRVVLLAFVLVAACVTSQRPKGRLAAGEILVRSTQGKVSPEQIVSLAKRTDFSVDGVECLNRTCRVLVSRAEGIADEDWTWGLVESLRAANEPGLTIEANVVQDQL